MRRLLPAIILLSLTACNPWQYMTIHSSQLARNSHNQLEYENDTLRLTYVMDGKDGAMTLRILNKLNEPLYVNWKKSAFIRNELSTSFYDNNILVRGHNLNDTRSASYNANKANFTASFVLPDGMDFIPPTSSISKDLPSLSITGPLQIDLPDSLAEKTLTQASSDRYFVRYKELHYDEASTPIRFRTYLTFSVGTNNREFSETNHFYISDVYLANGRPQSFTLYHGQADQIYIRSRMSNPAVSGSQSTASSGIR